MDNTKGQPPPPCPGSEVNHLPLSRIRGQPPLPVSRVRGQPPPHVQGHRSTTPPCPGPMVNHLPLTRVKGQPPLLWPGSEVNHLPPLSRVRGQPPPTHHKHPGTIHRRVVRILLECILVSILIHFLLKTCFT